MIKKIFIWFDDLSTWPKIFLNAISISLPFYFAAFLSTSLSEVYQAGPAGKVFIHFAIYGFSIFIIVFFYRLIYFYFDRYKEDISKEHEAIYRAFTYLDRTVINQHAYIKNAFAEPEKNLHLLIASIQRIQEIIDDVYHTFEAVYGNQERSGDRIDFEATFMTKSYKDYKIIIPCSKNRDGRKPRSMIHREKDPEIYDNSETAKLYRAGRPCTIIIPDTSVESYASLYPDQKNRIKSTIVHPVLCEDNILLGTLVVHCDKQYFFTKDKEKFWCDLFEIFAKRISVEKIKLDYLEEITRSGKINITLEHELPF